MKTMKWLTMCLVVLTLQVQAGMQTFDGFTTLPYQDAGLPLVNLMGYTQANTPPYNASEGGWVFTTTAPSYGIEPTGGPDGSKCITRAGTGLGSIVFAYVVKNDKALTGVQKLEFDLKLNETGNFCVRAYGINPPTPGGAWLGNLVANAGTGGWNVSYAAKYNGADGAVKLAVATIGSDGCTQAITVGPVGGPWKHYSFDIDFGTGYEWITISFSHQFRTAPPASPLVELFAIDNVSFPTMGESAVVKPTYPGNNVQNIASPVTLDWESIYSGDGQLSKYTVYMDTDKAKVEAKPSTATLIAGAQVTPPTTEYAYTGPIALETSYYWRVDTLVYDPNYNAGQPDPNIPVYNTAVTYFGPVWKFTGIIPVPIVTAVSPAEAYIMPNPATHVYDSKQAVFTADVDSYSDIASVKWYKDGSPATLITPDGVKYVVAFENGTAKKTTLTINNCSDADEGKYYVVVTAANSKSATSAASGSLWYSSGLRHRYSFTGDITDSIGGANGTITGTTGLATFADGKLTLGNTGVTSAGDPNGVLLPDSVYVDLPNGIISKLGNHATILVWYTVDDTSFNEMRVFDFGTNVKGEGFAGAVSTAPDNASNNYIHLTPKTSTNGPVGVNTTAGVSNSQTGSMMPVAGTEYCVAYVWDGAANQLRQYVNGAKNPSDTDPLTRKLYELPDVNNWLGRSQWNSHVMFKGKYNELRIYDIALTELWIKSLYEKGTENLVGNPCINTNAYDYTGDCRVNIADFAVFANQWLFCGLVDCS